MLIFVKVETIKTYLFRYPFWVQSYNYFSKCATFLSATTPPDMYKTTNIKRL